MEDMEMAGPEGPIPVRIYRPSEKTNLPALVYFHGGGWVIGDIDWNDGMCRQISDQANCVVISVEYRLAPEDVYPAAADDAYAATVWAVQNAKRLEIDEERIAVGGWSAGATLAAVVCLMLRDRGGPKVRHQLLICPATDSAMDTESYLTRAEGFGLTADTMEWFWNHYDPAGRRAEPYASPLLADDLSQLPSAHVITADYDPLRDEGIAYAEALDFAGVDVIVKNYEGQIHTFVRETDIFPMGAQALADASNVLRDKFEAS
jgi:acetyl esterase